MSTLHQRASLPGKTLSGQYVVSALVGSGSVCDVYVAQQVSLFRRNVAVRVLKKSICSSATAEAQLHKKHFFLEAELLTRLKAHCFVRLFDAGSYVDDNVERPFVVLEYLEGPTVWNWVKEQAPLLSSALRVASEVGSGLVELSQHSIAFRDLNPTNVILETCGAMGQRARLFDMTHVLPCRDGAAGAAERLLVGVPPFAPPEQGDGLSGEAGDVWSLAALLFYMVERRAPFDTPRHDWAAFKQAAAGGVELSLQGVEKRVRGELEALLGAGMALDPGARPSLTEFMAGLAALQEGHGPKGGGAFRAGISRLFG